jgi:MFS transporter, FHS family, glucose/mannose:H+ symporter
VTPNSRPWPWPWPAAGIVGCLSFLLLGWSGLLAPSLIRSLKDSFDQTDAGIGLLYFVYAIVYAVGSLGGGLATERLGRRTVLSAAAVLHGIGFIGYGFAPSWTWFLIAALPAGLGAGALDGGGNGLFLDLYQSGRGRALNLLHVFFSVGALSAPLVVGRLVESGVAWPSITIATGVAALVVGVMFLFVTMPDGRHKANATPPAGEGSALGRPGDRLAAPLILLAVAIACYVASEIGVSNWLVRFLEPAPLSVATTALSLFWAGLTLGRLLAARFADRFDHVRFAAVSSTAMSVALVAAILVPSLPVSIALFALAGVATGPVFPMVIAIGGDRYPDRTAAVGGFLASAAVVGSIVYPPIMGFLSVTVGLTVAMLGTVLLGLASAAALVLVGRQPAGGPSSLDDPERVDFEPPSVMLATEPSDGEGTR